MAFVDVFDHGDLKLTRQTDDRRGGQEGDNRPTRPEDILGAFQNIGRDVAEDLTDPAGDTEDREGADPDQRDQLDDRLDRDGGDDPVVALVRVQVPGTEQNGEQRHAGRDPEGGVDIARIRRDDLIAAGHRLQLQGDVWGRRDQGDDGHQDRKALAFAIAR